MLIFLGLGSNLGERQHNLARAIRLLEEQGVRRLRISPVVESPALLPEGAPADWNMPYLNLILEAEYAGTPEQMRTIIVDIQNRMGRTQTSRWAPRPMDIDIILWGDESIATPTLTVPHVGLHKRGFVLSPLLALAPLLTIPGNGSKTLLDWSQELHHHIPLWMGILNLTPDSFSDGGHFQGWQQIEAHLDAMLASGVNIIDLGAESTRPGATPLTAQQEWARLEPVLTQVLDKLHDQLLRPQISIDTYHPEVARQALELGVGMINDVGGLSDPAMLELAASAPGVDWVAMHNLGLPVDRRRFLPADADPLLVIETWLQAQQLVWNKVGIDPARIILDPGIGFGKDGLQSQKLLQQASRLRQHGHRLLIGHSRKSFMKPYSGQTMLDRDLATIGATLQLCEQGVDILRIHNVPAHVTAYRGWSHLKGC